MSLPIRLLLVWLLAFALPVQGFGAATMQFCGAGGAMEQQAHAVEAAPHGHEARAHDAGHHHAAHAADAQQPADDAGQHKCSACAACCMATALPPGVTLPPAPPSDVQTAQPVPSIYADPDASGLERPPRPRLA